MTIEPVKFTLSALLLSLSLAACSAIQPPAPIVSPQQSDGSGYSSAVSDQGSQIYSVQKQPQSEPVGGFVSQSNPQQVTLIAQNDQQPNVSDIPEFYTVQPGENLFRIASRFGLNYRDVAQLNNINPDALSVGQVIRLRPASAGASGVAVPSGVLTIDSPSAVKTPIGQTDLAQSQARQPLPPPPPQQIQSQPAKSDSRARRLWPHPTDGKIVERFNPKGNSTGLRYSGVEGQPIRAVNDGKVVYTGDTIRGYGNLILVRDQEGLIIAYGNNKTILVKLDDDVKANQQIALMGIDPATKTPTLKFEVRKAGNPIDPTPYLIQ